MNSASQSFDRAEVIIAWQNGQIVGYAVQEGGYWWCVDKSHPHRRRQICHSAGDCIVWLRQTTGSRSYQTLADRDVFMSLLGSMEIEEEVRHVAATQPVAAGQEEYQPFH